MKPDCPRLYSVVRARAETVFNFFPVWQGPARGVLKHVAMIVMTSNQGVEGQPQGGDQVEMITVDQMILIAGGFGNYQRRLLLLCSLCFGSATVVIMQAVFLLPLCAAEFSLDEVQEGLISSAFFGGFFGANQDSLTLAFITTCLGGLYLYGWVGDIHGRRAQLLWSLAAMDLFSILAFLSPNYLCMLALRCACGGTGP